MMTKSGVAINRKSGLDYLVFWAYGEFEEHDEIVERFRFEREACEKIDHARYFQLGGIQFEMSPYGAGRAQNRREWQLMVGGVQFGFCYDGMAITKIRVEVKGAQLLQLGEAETFRYVKRVFQALGFRYTESKISRVDIRSDHTEFSVSDIHQCYTQGKIVDRAKNHSVVYGGSHADVQTFYCGLASSPICCRFYDKLKEVEGDPRKEADLLEFVTKGEVVEVLTRVEFQLKREAITSRYRISSVEDFLARLAYIIEDLTTNWVRVHKSEVDRKNSEKGHRHKVHKFWVAVQSSLQLLADTFGDRVALTRVVEVETVQRQKSTVSGYLAAIVAASGINFRSVREFKTWLVEEFGVLMRDGDWVDKVNKKRKKLRARRLEDALAYFENREKNQVLLFE